MPVILPRQASTYPLGYEDEDEYGAPDIDDEAEFQKLQAGSPTGSAPERSTAMRPLRSLDRMTQAGARQEAHEKARPNASDFKPKGWQRALAGVAAGAAGYVNAGGRVRVDPRAVENITGSLMRPGYRGAMEKWQDQGKESEAEMRGATRDYQIESAQQKATNDAERVRTAQTTAEATLAMRRRQEAEAAKPKRTAIDDLKDRWQAGGGVTDSPEYQEFMKNNGRQPRQEGAKTLEAMAVSIVGDANLNPQQKAEKLNELKKAYNTLHPKSPVTRIVQGADGTITAFTVAPEDVATAGGTKKLGQVVPKPNPSNGGGESSGYDYLADDIIEGKRVFANLTAKERAGVGPILSKRGWTEPAKLGEKEKATIAGIEDLRGLTSELASIREANKGSLPGIGRWSGNVGAWMDSWLTNGTPDELAARRLVGQLRGTIAKLQGGTALSAQEIKFLDQYTPQAGERESIVLDKLKGLESFLDNREKNIRSVASKSGRSGSAVPEDPGPPPISTGKTMRIQKNGKIAVMPVDKARRLIDEANWVEVK